MAPQDRLSRIRAGSGAATKSGLGFATAPVHPLADHVNSGMVVRSENLTMCKPSPKDAKRALLDHLAQLIATEMLSGGVAGETREICDQRGTNVEHDP